MIPLLKPQTGQRKHSNDENPDFDEVFEDYAIKRLDIVITEAHWQSMLDDMTS